MLQGSHRWKGFEFLPNWKNVSLSSRVTGSVCWIKKREKKRKKEERKRKEEQWNDFHFLLEYLFFFPRAKTCRFRYKKNSISSRSSSQPIMTDDSLLDSLLPFFISVKNYLGLNDDVERYWNFFSNDSLPFPPLCTHVFILLKFNISKKKKKKETKTRALLSFDGNSMFKRIISKRGSLEIIFLESIL